MESRVQDQARVVIIGGGVVGASILYHLSKLGCSDAIMTMRLCSFVMEPRDADLIGDEPILHHGNVVGWVTSGGYAHDARKSIAQGYVPKDIANDDSGWSIELLGENLAAKRQKFPLFDANSSRIRS